MYSSDDGDEDSNENKDKRITQKMRDRRRVPEGELSDSEDEGYNRRERRSYKERSFLAHSKEGINPKAMDVDSAPNDNE
jgi:hypothetical protein